MIAAIMKAIARTITWRSEFYQGCHYTRLLYKLPTHVGRGRGSQSGDGQGCTCCTKPRGTHRQWLPILALGDARQSEAALSYRLGGGLEAAGLPHVH